MSVRVSDSLSDPIEASRGVPQGSVLGPRLFLVFINDLPDVLGPKTLLFADDAKIWRTVKKPEDSLSLQRSLDAAYNWSITNDIRFNVPKCKVLSLRHKGFIRYTLGHDPLPYASTEKDLGVAVCENLGCSVNSERASAMATKQLGLLKRAFGPFEPAIFPRLLAAYIRPHTEYAIQAWSPWLQRDRKALERPQRMATKMVKGLGSKSYTERLRTLELYSSYYRRIRGDMILVYNILHRPHDPCRSLLSLSPNVHLRGHPLKLKHQRSRLECRRHSFAVRVCAIWNSLPTDVVCAPTTECFKIQLDKALCHRKFEHL